MARDVDRLHNQWHHDCDDVFAAHSGYVCEPKGLTKRCSRRLPGLLTWQDVIKISVSSEAALSGSRG